MLTTESVFDLTEAPESLAILDGGAVGCELAQAFARLGVRGTVVEAADRLLPGIEPEASDLLAEVFAAEGITVHNGAQVTAASIENGRACCAPVPGSDVQAQRLLVAVGRRPDTAELGLEAAGVRTDEHGFVTVDQHMATTAEGVYAAGDVTGLFPHTHGAYAMGRVAVGAAEHDVTDRRVRVAYLPMSEVDRAITADRTAGFVKLLAGPRPVLGNLGGGRVLGATVMCRRAGELIHEPALAMRTNMFTGRLAQTVHAYPTWSIAVQQAAAQFFGGYGGCTARPAGQPSGK